MSVVASATGAFVSCTTALAVGLAVKQLFARKDEEKKKKIRRKKKKGGNGHELTPICMPTLYIRAGKAVAYHQKQQQPVDNHGAPDAVERAQTLGLLGELAVTALDGDKATWEAVDGIVRSGVRVRLEGVGTLDDALRYLDKGVAKVVLAAKTWEDEEARRIIDGTKYRDRFMALVVYPPTDVQEEEAAGKAVARQITKLSEYVSEVLVEFVGDKRLESVVGSSCGNSSVLVRGLADIRRAADAGGERKKRVVVTVAGGIRSVETLVAIEGMGLRPQVGNALATGELEIADLIIPFIRTDRPDKLFTTVVVDEQHVALGLVYSNKASVREAMKKRAGIYHSRRRGLWHKGLTSGATQALHEVCLDCDRDALRYVVRQKGAGFCHLNRYTCWDEDRGVGHLFRTLLDRKNNPAEGSYTNRLLNDTEMLNAKMLEEAQEIIEAKDKNHVAAEAADVLYFASVVCTRAGVSFKDVENHLNRRSRRVRRRKGHAKPYAVEMLRKVTERKKS